MATDNKAALVQARMGANMRHMRDTARNNNTIATIVSTGFAGAAGAAIAKGEKAGFASTAPILFGASLGGMFLGNGLTRSAAKGVMAGSGAVMAYKSVLNAA